MVTSRNPLVFDTPDGIELFRLASLKGRIKLEAIGMRASGGGKSTRAAIAAELGLKPRSPHSAFLDELTKRINVLKAKILREQLIIDDRGDSWMVKSCDRSCLIMPDLEVTDRDVFKVFYYIEGVAGEAKPITVHESAPAGLDAAEAWVLEVR